MTPRSSRALSWLPVLFFFTFSGALGLFPLMNRDIGIQIVMGRHILEHWVPETNLFSAFNQDHPIVDHEWAFQVVTTWIADGLGPAALAWFRLGLVLVLGLLMLKGAMRGKTRPLILLIIAAGIFLAHPRFMWRPDFISLLYAATYLKILLDDAEKKSPFLWLLPILQLAWANMHGYFIVGLILMGTFWVGALSNVILFKKEKDSFRRLTIVSLVSLGACFINPFFHEGALYPIKEVTDLFFDDERVVGTSVTELQSPFSDLFENIWAVKFWIPMAIAFGLTALLQGRRFHLGAFLAGLAAITMAYSTYRNIGLLGVITGTITAWQLRRALTPFEGSEMKPLRFATAAAMTLILAFATFVVGTNRLWADEGQIRKIGTGVLASRLDPPSRAFIDEHLPEGPVLNSFGNGSSFLWWFYPERKPFINGFTGGYPKEFLKEYREIIQAQKSPKKLIEQYDLKWAYLELDKRLTVELMKDPDWIPVFLDESAAVLVRNVPEFADLIEQHDLSKALLEGTIPGWTKTPSSSFFYVRYPSTEIALGRFLADVGYVKAAMEALTHALTFTSDHKGLHILAGRTALRLPEPDRAREHCNRALELDPEFPPAFALSAAIHLQKGEYDDAEAAALRAAELAQDNVSYWLYLGSMRQSLAKPQKALEALEKVLELEPENPHIHRQIGMVHFQLGRMDEARPHFEKFMELAPDSPMKAQIEMLLNR